MKTKKIILFTSAVVVQLIILAYFSFYSLSVKKAAEKNGSIYTYKCTAYDPYNPFKGRYLRLTVTEWNIYVDKRADYYLQENYADIVDSIKWTEFNSLQPELELYVDAKHRFVQKGVTVLKDPENPDSRMPIEEYLEYLKGRR